MKKAKRRTRAIVVGHLEKIGSGVFERYQDQIRNLVGKDQGVYALYKRQKLYYIGLTRDLKARIWHHLRDRHKGNWDRFSVYVMKKEEHIREVESLLLRIAEPEGNRVRGKLGRSKNLVRELDAAIKERQKEERWRMLRDGKGKAKRKKVKKHRRKGKEVERPLRGKFPGGKVIYASYKGKDYKAWVRANGGIRYNGRTYDSPSGAGKGIRKKETDGWRFWKYKDKKGNLVLLKNLRK
jgi:hypothetical protein